MLVHFCLLRLLYKLRTFELAEIFMCYQANMFQTQNNELSVNKFFTSVLNKVGAVILSFRQFLGNFSAKDWMIVSS